MEAAEHGGGAAVGFELLGTTIKDRTGYKSSAPQCARVPQSFQSNPPCKTQSYPPQQTLTKRIALSSKDWPWRSFWPGT